MAVFFLENSFLRRIFYKIEDLFKSPVKLLPDSEREEIELPSEGYATSVEMALNSRCNSDYDGNPKRFHWGMFDRTKKLSDTQIEKIVHLAKIPRFTDGRVEIQTDSNMLTFVSDNHVSGIQRDWMMVESGMQQQAVGLVCAALGVGMVFRNQGKDGTALSDTDYATVKIKLDAMKPSYNGSFWNSYAPTGRKSWASGKMPDPVRDGHKPLISTLERLKIENTNGTKSTDESVSQLLWAARGRTPHLYKSKPWGMTIPTWGGEQHISSAYLVTNNELSEYINWDDNRPTHFASILNKIDNRLIEELNEKFSSNHTFIILAKNEDFARSLWEVGYQLLNLLAQAHSLGVSYQAVLLDETRRAIVSRMGVKNPVAVFAI